MKDEIKRYINNQLERSGSRLLPYVASGSWIYPRRPAFIRIEKHIKDFIAGKKDVRWIIIPGLRGVGKTTLVAQTYHHFKRKFKENHIVYISVDDIVTAGFTLRETLDAYEEVLGINFESTPEPILLLIDEVQQDAKWAAVLKGMFDKARNVFVISTGSSAVHLQTNPDVARRGVFEKLYPLCFWEYQMLKHNKFPVKDLKKNIKSALYDSSSAEEAYGKLSVLKTKVDSAWNRAEKDDLDLFLSTGTMPFTLNLTESDAYDRISLLIDRMINKDIQELGSFDAQTVGIIKRLLFIMADGLDGLSVSKVSQILGVQRPTLTAVLDALERAEIIIRVAPHGSEMKAARKPSKYLFMSPAIRMSLLSITGLDQKFLQNRGKLMEDIAGLHFYREFVAPGAGKVTYDSAEEGADFILQIANKKQLAIEIGLGDKDLRQVRKTMEKVKCDYGVVVCASDSVVLSQEDNIIKVPLEYFLMM